MNRHESMNLSHSHPSSIARSMTARAILLVAGLSTPAFGQFRDWDTGNGIWSNVVSWSPNGLPLSTETARIGIHAAAVNTDVDLDMNDTVAGLQISDGMTLDLNAFQLVVNGTTTISGKNVANFINYPSTLRVRPSAAATEFSTAALTLTNEAELRTVNEPVMQISGLCSIDATSYVTAGGVMNFTSNAATALRNEGILSSGISALTLNQLGTGLFDLDGNSGDGIVAMNLVTGSDLFINGTQLSDPFSGHISMTSESRLVMNLDQPWEADAASELSVSYPFVNPFGPARLEGAPVTLSGSVEVIGTDAVLRVLADATMGPNPQVTVGIEDSLEFEGDTVINGGNFSVSTGGSIDFEGPTVMHAGSFQTVSNDFADGGIAFLGATQWNGTVTINGAARHNGNATVSGPTVINAGEFDMDGGGGASASTWNILSGLVINAERIDQPSGSNDSGRFHGTININAGFSSRLTIDVAAPGFYWGMDGELNLTGHPVLFLNQVSGDRMSVSGDLNVISGRSQIECDMTVYGTAVVDIGPASAILRITGDSNIYPVAFTGFGNLQNGEDADMHFADGVDLNQTGLINQGDLTLSTLHTFASVDRFEQVDTGELIVSLGGYTPGVEHDLLAVTDGTAQLDGTLTVALPALGGVQFYPQAGDNFVIITADDGVIGAFDNDPVSHVDDLTFQWDVVHNPFNVTLHLVSVTPQCPGDANGDGIVNGSDLSVLLSQIGQSIEQWSDSDLNGDGIVNGSDLSVILANFGDSCGAMAS